ncbi:hypothetical protein J2S43_007120 [Catenuloplanes nepalensis]|uniref:DUF4178 domain-containing protein n=1 Tax=Catenuloplanes nepalensis TaxID=587533 RepID=A0ABT9N4H8_9ACTN|nr:hypothetical protein [Catenuloplanes nepalensis]MDP9798608.1 hypothetical protein [Catenuloplanes nepalensis]
MDPKAGDVLVVDRRASVQFNGDNALILRVISVSDRATYDGWAWIAGYVLDPETGEATVRREIFVLRGGLRLAASGSALMRRGGRWRSI